MNASRTNPRIVCTVVRVPDHRRLAGGRDPRRPSTLLPWADPYIAGLVRKLQSEVRMERASRLASDPRTTPPVWSTSAPRADAEPPSPKFAPDWSLPDELPLVKKTTVADSPLR